MSESEHLTQFQPRLKQPSPLKRRGQVLAGLVGISLVAYMVGHIGLDQVLHALRGAAYYFPAILLCEFFFWFFGTLSQRALYGVDAKKIPWGTIWRSGFTAYAIMGLIPMGRIVAESARAVAFAPYVGKPKAAVVAVQVQILALCVTALVAGVSGLFIVTRAWGSPAAWLAIANAGGALVLAVLAAMATKHLRLGQKLGFLLPRIQLFGQEFDAHFAGSAVLPRAAFGYELLCRLSQIVQNGLLVMAVGGALGISNAFCSEGLHLIGATLGDLVPGQWGVTELVYGETGSILGLGDQGALGIALQAHLAQLFWVFVTLLMKVLL